MNYLIALFLFFFPLFTLASPPKDMCYDGLVIDSVGKLINENEQKYVSDEIFETIKVTITPLWNNNSESNIAKMECPALLEILYGKTNTIEERLITYVIEPLNSGDSREYRVRVVFPDRK